MGHTFPGACVPFGLVQLSPDTDTIPHNVDGKYQPRSYEYCAGYQHKDSSIVGFSHTHFSGTGHSDLGDILMGNIPLHRKDDEIIVYSIGGMPVEDVAWGTMVYRNALKKGIGTKLKLWDTPQMV